MTKLQTMLPDLNRELHEKKAFRGDSWERWQERFRQFVGFHYSDDQRPLVLDYGCGPSGGMANASPAVPGSVVSYDPYVAAYSAYPWTPSPEVFFSCDVFEHMTTDELHRLFARIRASVVSHLFVVLSTRPATKTFSNGLNVHLTVRPASWWHGLFVGALPAYQITQATADLMADEVVFTLSKTAPLPKG